MPAQPLVGNLVRTGVTHEGPRESTKLMKTLKMLQKDLQIGILVLAHTPKRLSSGYLTVNDLAGNKAIANFADNIFAIGRSRRDPISAT